jgi:hypothetical protein
VKEERVQHGGQSDGGGFLAIWSDIDPAAETDYLHWMSREHAGERLGIPGFLSMRMFRALDRVDRRYFILYELANASVVDSAGYLARLNHPSAWSKRMMPQLRNFVRGGGRVAAAFGSGRGGLVAPLRLGADDVPASAAIAAEIASHDRVTSVRVLATDSGRTAVQTTEKGMRAGDRSFAALLLVEGLDAGAIRAAMSVAMQARSPSSDLTIYQTIFALDHGGT